MTQVLGAIIGMLMFSMLWGSIYLWWNAYQRFTRGQPLLAMEPRRPVSWGLLDLVVIFLIVIFTVAGGQIAADRIIQAATDVPPERIAATRLATALFSSSLSMLASCLVSLALLKLRGASLADLGWQSRKFFSDVILGAAAFVMLAPPMYLMQFALTRIWPSEHPLQTMLLNDPQWGIIIGAVFTAVVVAPISEEVFFRLIFQGWLEKFSTLATKLQQGYYDLGVGGAEQARVDTRSVFLGEGNEPAFVRGPEVPQLEPSEVAARRDVTERNELATTSVIPESAATHSSNPYAPPAAESKPTADKPTKSEDAASPPPKWWPIFASASIFALLHWGHGPDPAPLFFLAVGLGYLYQRTHRIVPCIVVHFLVNGLSMLALILFLLTGGEPP